MNSPLVSIVAMTCNRLKLTRRHLPEAIARLGYDNAELVLWDNGSADGTVEWLESRDWLPQTTIVAHRINIGFRALAEAQPLCHGDYLLKLDDDVVCPPGFLHDMVAAITTAPEPVGMLSMDVKLNPAATGSPPMWHARRMFGGEAERKRFSYAWVPPEHRRTWQATPERSAVIGSPDAPGRSTCLGACRLSRMDLARRWKFPKPFALCDYRLTQHCKRAGYWWGVLLGDPVVHMGRGRSARRGR